ncbi:FAD-dependent monooxygenase [Fodinicola acaciae]|uniref:FAD-dependent monooxygenase n=1 Tax=Fodinicola acaciae TaxID=2681555 RepID=UPI0013D8B028|nr:FAD-dependent monooxygenase [Fodinicola acaciae]
MAITSSAEPTRARSQQQKADVLVVGAGPAGLLLAGDLATAGVRTTVLERRGAESNLSRAFAVHARSLELLDARGLADELIAMGTKLSSVRLFSRFDVHLDRLPSRFPYLLVTPQYNVERLLERRAVAAGAQIVRGAEVVALHQDETGVDVTVRRHANGPTGRASALETQYRGSYLVGTDGVRSTVRKALSLPFPGRSAVQSVMLADVRLTQTPPAVLTANGTKNGFAFIAPFGDGWYRVMAWNRRHQLPDSAPVDLGEVAAMTREALGTDFGMHDPRFLSRFHSDERQAPRYRVGRVFLAGDAAHVHSPAGGQGMNTGLQDAANLSWKLAAAVHGCAPDSLLDSYQAERHPAGQAVLRSSGAILRMALASRWWQRAARALAGTLVSNISAVNLRAGLSVSGIAVRYPAPRGSHPLIGRRAADVTLAATDGGERLYEALRDGKFVLLVSSTATAGHTEVWSDHVRIAVAGTTEPADVSARYVLVRPDGYVAWAGSDETGALRALRAWCRTPKSRATVG